MGIDKQTFLTRLGSAAIFSAIMLVGLLWHYMAFIGLFFLVNILCLREYATLLEKIVGITFSRQEKSNYVLVGITTFMLLCLLPLTPCNEALGFFFNRYFFYFLGLIVGAIILFVAFNRNKKSYYLLTGIGYISISFGLLVQLRYQSLLLPLSLILMIWMNDTMAYLVGSFIGKTKFIPSISPKKTLEGTIGGILFTLAFSYVWFYFSNSFSLTSWLVLGAIAAVIGTIGDLVESKLKRLAGVKDSGSIMPGHGGALDRFDSLILASPVAFIYCLFCVACHWVKVF